MVEKALEKASNILEEYHQRETQLQKELTHEWGKRRKGVRKAIVEMLEYLKNRAEGEICLYKGGREDISRLVLPPELYLTSEGLVCRYGEYEERKTIGEFADEITQNPKVAEIVVNALRKYVKKFQTGYAQN
jgi:hypothetical protein